MRCTTTLTALTFLLLIRDRVAAGQLDAAVLEVDWIKNCSYYKHLQELYVESCSSRGSPRCLCVADGACCGFGIICTHRCSAYRPASRLVACRCAAPGPRRNRCHGRPTSCSDELGGQDRANDP